MVTTTSLEKKRSLLSGGYTITFVTEGKTSPPLLSALASGLFSFINSKLLHSNNELINFKGRDVNVPLTLTSAFSPIGDELFFYTGNIPFDEDALHHKTGERFEYHINSTFVSFPKPNQVTHRAATTVTGTTPILDNESLIWGFPVFPAALRFGLDIFRSQYFSSLLGMVPTVKDRVCLEATTEQFKLIFSSSGVSNPTLGPIEDGTVFQSLVEVFKVALLINLAELFNNECTK